MAVAGRYLLLVSDFERAFTYIQRAWKAVARTNEDYRDVAKVLEQGGEPLPGAGEIVTENMHVLRSSGGVFQALAEKYHASGTCPRIMSPWRGR